MIEEIVNKETLRLIGGFSPFIASAIGLGISYYKIKKEITKFQSNKEKRNYFNPIYFKDISKYEFL